MPGVVQRDGPTMYHVTLRLYEELNDFLPPVRRKVDVEVTFPEPRSIKDLIEAQGVPHTEIDLLLVNGEPVGFDYLVRAGDRIAVYPVFETLDIRSTSRLGREPLRVVRFIADVHLGTLVRRLRLLGLDCTQDLDWDDAEIAERSVAEHRVVLTRDRGLLMRSMVTHGIFLHSDDPDEQVQEVLTRLDLERELAPFSRCPACNGMLEPLAAEEAEARVPPQTFRHYDEFYGCQSCERVYWKGAHWPKLRALVDKYLDAVTPAE